MRDPTPEELAGYVESIRTRVDRLNRITFLAGNLSPDELHGLIVFAEEALRDRRSLVGLTRQRAAEGLAYMLPDEVW